MSDAEATTPAAGPGPLIERMFAWVETTAVAAAAEIGLFDRLAAGPRTAAEVASELGASEARMARLLRDLTGTGVVVRAGPDRFALGPEGEFLRSDVPGSVRGLYRMFRGPIAQGLLKGEVALRNDSTAFDEVMGAPFFDYLARHPEDGTVFNTSMVHFGVTLGTPPIHAYDFSGVRRLIDVGGGHGQLALEVLRAYPGIEAVVFDAPEVVAETVVEIERAGLSGRCEAIAGDFFKSVPAGGDCYVLRWIIHDWNDERSETILRCCREAIDPTGRLLLFEFVMPDVDGPHPAKTLDWVMLACVSGQERSEAEYAALLERAGFRLTRVVPSPTPMSVVEAVPV
jgi:O-methyltransferase domain/Dimerisation domain